MKQVVVTAMLALLLATSFLVSDVGAANVIGVRIFSGDIVEIVQQENEAKRRQSVEEQPGKVVEIIKEENEDGQMDQKSVDEQPDSVAAPDTCFEIQPFEREECGWKGISKEQCEARRCCYDDTVPQAYYCFSSFPEICARIPARRRQECGFAGITRDQCLAIRCCYDDSDPGATNCFVSFSKMCKQIDPAKRVECGWPGISRTQCGASSCCFDDTVPGAKSCFKLPPTEDGKSIPAALLFPGRRV